jgi:6-phosphogluconolactonase
VTTPTREAPPPTARSGRVVWHASADEASWVTDSTDAIVHAMRDAASTRRFVHLLLSGGTTPAPVYRALSERTLDWPRVTVGLVDERDVEPDADGSNARLIRETLLRGAAVPARFQPLRGTGRSLDDAVRAANERFVVGNSPTHDRANEVGLVVLGMGDDGHTASLFPGATNLPAALMSRKPYAAIDATGCQVAGAFAHRITLTPAGLAYARHRILLIRGTNKRLVFERALRDGPSSELPIRYAIDLAGAPLQVYWCL